MKPQQEKIIRIDPFSDFGFKFFFGKENQSEPLLKDFLNDIFYDIRGFEPIKTVTFKPTVKVKDRPEEKGIINDITCETDSGHKFIVEMQNAGQDFFLKRAIYYVSDGISQQGHKGSGDRDWEFNLKPVVGVFICNFRVRGVPEKLVTHALLCDMDDGKPIGNYMHYVFINASLFNNTEEECKTGFEMWMYILKNMKSMQEIPFKDRKRQIYERLDQLSRYSAMTEEEQVEYESSLKWARDYNARMNTARREGRAEGKWEMAAGLIEMNVDLDTISKASGIPVSDLKSKFS